MTGSSKRSGGHEPSDPKLPPGAAARIASTGTREQLHELVANQNLSADVILTIIESCDWEIAGGLLLNYELPTDLLLLLQARFADHVPDEMISGHPNAPLIVKYGLRVGDLTGLQLARFFDAVRATEDERRAVDRAAEDDPSASLKAVWSTVR